MTSLKLDGFGGIAPKISPKKLGDQIATIAENVRLDQSRLDGWRGIAHEIDLPPKTVSAYKYQGKWLTSEYRRAYARTPIPNDARERLFFTDTGFPKYRSFDQEFKLGLPRPDPCDIRIEKTWYPDEFPWIPVEPSEPVDPPPETRTEEPPVEPDPPPADDDLPEERPKPNEAPLDFDDRAYCISWVDAWGQEGPLSLPSNILEDVFYLDTVRINLPAAPDGPYNFGEGSVIRVYRSNTSSTGNVYQFMCDLPLGTTQHIDESEAKDLQEIAPNDDWIGPPDDDAELYPDGPLAEMLECPGAFLFGWSGNQFCFSEPYMPHVWPSAYRLSHMDKPVAAAVVNGGIFVATDEQPVLIAGNHPSAMAIVPIDSDQPCLSRESMVDMGGYCLYAGPDGLVQAEGAAARVVSEAFFTRSQWQLFDPSKLVAYKHEGKYFAENPETGHGFVYDPAGDTATFVILSGQHVKDYHYVIEEDTTYVVYGAGETAKLGRFNEGANVRYRWRSKEFLLPMPDFFSVGRIESELTNRFTLWADDEPVFEADIEGNEPFRLPLMPKAKKWQFEVESDGAIEMIGLFSSMGEVA